MGMTLGTPVNWTVTMEGPFAAIGSAVRLGEIQLSADGWKGAISPWSQTVSLDTVSVNSKVDILLSPWQLETLRSQELIFTTENDGGIVTVYAIGHKPDTDLTFQVAITEVTA